MARTKEEIREQVRKSLKKRRQRLKASGLCVDCGQNPPFPRHTLCIGCLNDRKAREQDRRHRIAMTRIMEDQQPKPVFAVDSQAPLQKLRTVVTADIETFDKAMTAATAAIHPPIDKPQPSLLSKIISKFLRLVGVAR